MPAKVAVRLRARVTAGLAKEVDAANQYAAAIYPPTAAAVTQARSRAQDSTTKTRPKVATNSLIHCPLLERSLSDVWSSGRSNMACASKTPAIAPTNWAIT